jgi:hypothetical protein
MASELTVGKVGIGAETFTPHNDADDLVIKPAVTSTGITIRCNGDGGTGSIFFADTSSNSVGQIRYNHNTDNLAITAADEINFTCDLATFSNGIAVTTGGIQFPATQSASADANTLDDYEEGSWTPVIGGGTCTNLNGKYTKVGRQVTVTVEVANGVLSGASGYIITGLPFPNGSTRSGTGTVASYSLMDNANPVGILVATTTQIDFVYNNASSNWSVANFVNTTGWLHFSATYFV